MKRVLLDREPHAEASGTVWKFIEEGFVEGMLAAHGVTTIHYLAREDRGAAFKVAPVDALTIERALSPGWSDFEDSVTAAAAQGAGCQAIVTRDPKGFAKSPIPVFTPEVVTAIIMSGWGPAPH
jgi:hypothetical protein